MPSQSDEFVARVAALIPMLQQQASVADHDRKIGDATIAAIRQAGFLRILQPRANGGCELSPEVLWRVTVEMARGCASTAWLVGLSGANVWLMGLFDATGRAEIFADGCDVLVPVLTGGVGRNIEVRETAGGYQVSGHWRYASGIDHADWVAALVPLREGPTLAVFEAAAFKIDNDSWHVLGMRGTGSKDVSLVNGFVPYRRTLAWSSIESGRKGATPLYRLPANPLLAMSVTAPLIGTARAIVDALVDAIGRRVAAGTGQAQIESQHAHIVLGQCAAEVGLAEMGLYENAARLYAGGDIDLNERARIRVQTVTAARTALSAANRAIGAVGGSLLPQGGPLERGFRDIHAMASHFLLQLDPSAEAYGRLLLGLPPPAGARL